MEWSEAYSSEKMPSANEIQGFIKTPLWTELQKHLESTYSVGPKCSYSGCSMQRGWNIKYQKSGRSLCTLYPMEGYFIALVVVGEREAHEVELALPLCSGYTRELYRRTQVSMGSRWLMMEVRDTPVLQDVKTLVALRVKKRAKK